MKKIFLFISIPFLFVLFITSFLYFYDFRTEDKIIVAVLDTGVDKEHELLQGKVLDGLDLLDYNFDPTDRGGHGTHIAGIIVSQNPDAQILPVRILKDEKEELWELKDVIAVLYAIISGADVINMSYTTEQNPWFDRVVDFGVKKGVIFVSSAGNEGKDTISYPASHPKVISVGNTYQDKDKMFKDSNYAKDIDFAAPGYEIHSSDINNRYSKKTGTSMSSAYLSGVVAYLLQHEEMNHEEIKSLLQRKSRKFIQIYKDEPYTFHRVDMNRIRAYVKKEPYMYIAPLEKDNSRQFGELELIVETENIEAISFSHEKAVLFELIPNNGQALRIRLKQTEFIPGENILTIIGKTSRGNLVTEQEVFFPHPLKGKSNS